MLPFVRKAYVHMSPCLALLLQAHLPGAHSWSPPGTGGIPCIIVFILEKALADNSLYLVNRFHFKICFYILYCF